MASPAPTRPTREQRQAALDLVLAESLNKTEAAAPSAPPKGICMSTPTPSGHFDQGEPIYYVHDEADARSATTAPPKARKQR